MDKEIWTAVHQFKGYYEVSNLGKVKSVKRVIKHKQNGFMYINEKILKPYKDKGGRYRVSLSRNNRNRPYLISKIVYFSFNRHLSYNDKLREVVHIDKCEANNCLNNLKLTTTKESGILLSKSKIRKGCNKERIGDRYRYAKENGIFIDKKMIKNKCNKCNIIKDISEFEPFRNTCYSCRKKMKNYQKRMKNGNK
jgi:hypothetical protein